MTKDDRQRTKVRRGVRPSEIDTGSLANDLRSAVAAIFADIARLDRRLGEPTNLTGRALERVTEKVAVLERMAADLFDLSRADSGDFELALARTDLSRLLTALLQRAVSAADQSRLSVEIAAIPFVQVDTERVERVIANIVTHALNAGSRTSPVSIRLTARHRSACLTVSGPGVGLTTEQAAALVDQQHAGGLRVGVSLYVSRRIVEAHGGRMSVANSPGKGSRIHVDLPLG